MQLIDYLPINNSNCVAIDLAESSVQNVLPKDAAGNTALYYYFQAAKGSMQIRLDAQKNGSSNFVSKFIILEGQNLVVKCDAVQRVTVDSLSTLPNKLYITALDCR